MYFYKILYKPSDIRSGVNFDHKGRIYVTFVNDHNVILQAKYLTTSKVSNYKPSI
jgi:hypothetical protein